jgi:hypothetical protein
MRVTAQSLLSITAIAMAGMVTGCAGGGSAATTVSGAIPQGVSQMQPAVISDGKCGHNHGVSVKPCTVTLTVSKPTATVMTKGPSGGTFAVRDQRCSARNIATVTGIGSNTYSVTAGTSKGSCEAKFIDKDGHNQIGIAQLSITNQV